MSFGNGAKTDQDYRAYAELCGISNFMNQIVNAGRGVSRAIWLSELAAAIDAAGRLANFIDSGRGGVDLILIKARIVAVRDEVETLRRARGGGEDNFVYN